MKLEIKNVKRLIIYFFFDEKGIVDSYVPYMLNSLKNCSSEIFVVANGMLTPEGQETFKKITSKVMVRENKGLDVWAYKSVLDFYGWDALSQFDEIVLMNHTIMGPVYPFEEMFDQMNQRDLDFWGITAYHYQQVPFNNKYGYIPRHVQSHWIAIRNSMIKSKDFQKYWDNMPEINGYDDSVCKHESIFTKTFADKGFKYDVYADLEDDYTVHPIIKDPVLLIKKSRCPIFKRRSFFTNYYDLLWESAGNQAPNLLKYLEDNKLYDTDMVWENILRTCNLADVRNAANLFYVSKTNVAITAKDKKIALVMHLYFADLIEYCFQYALSMPEYADIYITVPSDEQKKNVELIFAKGPWKNVTVIVIQNRGRDVSSLLVGFAPYVDKYDYVCFMHDKKVKQLDYATKGAYFSERCFENMLGSKNLVLSIIERFENEPRLGLVCPPPPNSSDFFACEPSKWLYNYDLTKKVADDLGLKVKIDKTSSPVAPLGTMFWFRAKGMKRLFDKNWKYEDFPPEPNKNDGTILHAIERIYSYVEQDAGYYTAYFLDRKYAENELTNFSYEYREIMNRLFTVYGYTSLWGMIDRLDLQIRNMKPSFINTNNIPIPSIKPRMTFMDVIHLFIPGFIWNPLAALYRKCGGTYWWNKKR